ncbi:hypothetical protein G9A89_005668 [Geosiphon pyriformis]|nr:hypothetical protein G9A89_005668 [Geosiphon pyriformis]
MSCFKFSQTTKHGMHKILNFFKREDGKGEPSLPWALERHYSVSNQILGVGSFAVVKECTEKRTKEKFALKIIVKKVIKGKENMLTTELDVLKKVNHKNIVKLHDLYETKSAVYIITDLAYGGELFSQLVLKGSYTERDASILVRQMLEGVAYLHDHEIVHRDLKPENLLFKDKSEDPILMITDFGLSKILTNHNDVLMTACGTPGYVAPEVLLQVGHGKPVDIWSVGVITYAMLCGYSPFYGEDQGELFECIMSGMYEYEPEYWSEISDQAKDLIDKFLTYSPESRITAKDALLHPWFESAQNVDLLRNVRKNFPARATFKKAITAVQGINRLKRMSWRGESKSISSNTLSADSDGQATITNMILDIDRLRIAHAEKMARNPNNDDLKRNDQDDGSGTQVLLKLHKSSLPNTLKAIGMVDESTMDVNHDISFTNSRVLIQETAEVSEISIINSATTIKTGISLIDSTTSKDVVPLNRTNYFKDPTVVG